MRFHLPAWVVVLSTAAVVAGWGCSSKSGGSGFDTGGSSSSSGGASSSSSGGNSGSSSGTGVSDSGFGIFGDSSSGPPPQDAGGVGCSNLQCNIVSCDGGKPTTISGKVMDPAGHNPLYNVVVLIPNTMGGVLPLIPDGLNADSCSCGALFDKELPIVDTVTAADGTFTLTNVPTGKNVPLVVQIGKWRKEILVPNVMPCQDNPAGPITLPKNGKDGLYASLPSIAVSTGGADTLECLLTRIGIDEAEFTGSPINTPSAHVHVFQGNGHAATGSPSSPTSLFDSTADLSRYDIVMFSCEGSPTAGASAMTAPFLADYINAGGRAFAEHYHYALFTDYSTSPGTAFPQFANVASWSTVGAFANDAPYTSDITGVIQTTLPNGKAFPEGVALKSWLGNVGALNASSEIVVPVANARDNAVVGSGNVATPWVQIDPSISPASTQYFSWDMPFNPPVSDAGVPQYCGRAVYSDMHVSGSAADYQGGNATVPAGCDATNKLSPDEDAIEFIFFDLSSCVVPIGFPPKPPPPPPMESGAQ